MENKVSKRERRMDNRQVEKIKDGSWKLGDAGGEVSGKARFQQSDHDTLRDGRKGDPQHKCCGKKWKFENIFLENIENSKKSIYLKMFRSRCL